MVNFKLCISDPSTGRTFQKEVKDSMARPFVGLNVGETIKGDSFELNGYELQITGGSDYCGFPMRKGILGLKKKIVILGGVGFKGAYKGIKKRKTVCGHKIHEQISQINLKVINPGNKKLNEIFNVPEEAKKEQKTKAKEEKEHKPEAKKEAEEKKQEAHKVKEQHKAEEKHEEKSTESKEEKK